MKFLKTNIKVFLFAIIFISCQKVIEFNGSITNPLVVVNSLLTPDSVVKAQLSETRFFLSNDSSFKMIDIANVSLFVNGLQKETLTYTTNGVFVATYKPLAGDSISLQVQVPEKNLISCSTDVEPQIPVISIDTTTVLTGINNQIISVSVPKKGDVAVIDTVGRSIGRTLKLVLNFKDNPSKQNFYRLVVYTKSYLKTKITKDFTFSFDDIVSGNTNKNNIGPPASLSSNKYNVFSDNLFNGKQYPLTFSVADNKNLYFPGKTPLVTKKELYVNLQSISRSYYLYLQTRSNIKTNTFFAEPVQVYSNVIGGIGILGSYSGNQIKITL